MEIYPYIRHSKKYYGKFDVVLAEKRYIPCYNLQTARTILKDLKREK